MVTSSLIFWLGLNHTSEPHKNMVPENYSLNIVWQDSIITTSFEYTLCVCTWTRYQIFGRITFLPSGSTWHQGDTPRGRGLWMMSASLKLQRLLKEGPCTGRAIHLESAQSCISLSWLWLLCLQGREDHGKAEKGLMVWSLPTWLYSEIRFMSSSKLLLASAITLKQQSSYLALTRLDAKVSCSSVRVIVA